MKHHILEQFGLNINESLIYNLLLSEGAKTPPELAVTTGITRANTYFVLQALIGKGLVERKEKKKKFLYSPLNPDKLVELVQKEKEELHEKEKVLSAILPELASMYNMHTNKPSVSYFEGKDGAKTLYNDIFLQKPAEAILFRSPLDDNFLGNDWIRKHTIKLTKAGIAMRVISPVSYEKLFEEIDGLKLLREVRYVKNKTPFDAEICVYNNRVAIISYGRNQVSTLIDNKELANTLRNVFELIWKNLK